MMFSLFAALVLGFQHAFELDHLAGIASFTNSSTSATLRNTMKWVTGHVAIVFAGALVLFSFFHGLVIQTSAVEPVVGIVLIALAANKLRHSTNSSMSTNHAHSGKLGLLHGLSGTGAFVALAFASAASAFDVVVFSVLFGLGLAAGAVVATVVLFAPFSSLLNVHGKVLNLGYSFFTAVVGLTLLF